SHFLKQRYVEWGLPEAGITVIENIADDADAEAAEGGREDGLFRVGFFGQLSAFKGIGVLIDAARLLEEEYNRTVSIELHGDYKTLSDELQAEAAADLARAGRNVRY